MLLAEAAMIGSMEGHITNRPIPNPITITSNLRILQISHTLHISRLALSIIPGAMAHHLTGRLVVGVHPEAVIMIPACLTLMALQDIILVSRKEDTEGTITAGLTVGIAEAMAATAATAAMAVTMLPMEAMVVRTTTADLHRIRMAVLGLARMVTHAAVHTLREGEVEVADIDD